MGDGMRVVGIRQKLVREAASCEFVPWGELDGKTVAVTGGTGLIGGFLVDVLLERAYSFGGDIAVVLLARDPQRAFDRFRSERCSAVQWDASSPMVPPVDADYVIHLACDTSSDWFLRCPVETISTVVDGAKSMLEYARSTGARICLASTMEVYASGGPSPLAEDAGGALDAMNPRNSYPEAKQLSEALAAAYAFEYGVHACVARLCQTFGVGVRRDDGRVFAEFARRCLAGEDIVLLTPGEKRNMYLSVQDAALALILLTLKGEAGLAYNVANESTFCSVREMAEAAARRFGDGRTGVRVEVDPEAARRFRAPGSINQDTSRLRALGWVSTGDLMDIYGQMIAGWREGRVMSRHQKQNEMGSL